MNLLEATDRLTTLVSDRLQGARILHLMQVEQFTDEVAFIVMWEDDKQYGTHRAVLSTKDASLADLMWGHYFLKNWEDDPKHRAMRDYMHRCHVGDFIP